MKVALDVMGGDHAPSAPLDGALLAVEQGFVAASEIVLVGSADRVRGGLAERGVDPGDYSVVDAPDELLNDESPVESMRRKPRNPVATGLGLVKAGAADAFVSAGSTGLVVACATVLLGCLAGIRRPGIAVTINGEKGPFIIIDVGANPQPKAIHLLHYAMMGSAYHHDTFGTEMPRVGLMNIGSEERKGNPLVKEAKALIEQNSRKYRFVGNVEGIDVFSGRCDVVVSDGFTGNVLLKVSEGVAEYLIRSISTIMQEENLDESSRRRFLGRLQADTDYSNYGGALLLGVNGIVTICHGRSVGPAIANAIRFASRAVGARLNAHIVAAASDAAS